MLSLIVPLLASNLQETRFPAPADLEFAGGEARFAIAFYRETASPSSNVVCSPFSLWRALAMAREGARGETAREMDHVLQYPDERGARFAALAAGLVAPQVGRRDERRPAYSLELATALFGQRSQPFEPEFLRGLKAAFDSEMHGVDFARAEEARTTINTWTSEHTHERVKEIIPPGLLDGNTRLVLVDTVHFLAAWQEPFRAEATRTEPFVRADETRVDAPFLHSTTRRPYAETERAQVVELVYEGGTMSMGLVLPKTGRTLADVTANEDFAAWTGALREQRIDLALPKYEFRFGRELRPVLEKLGLKLAFDAERADFSGILKDPLVIGAVLQEAFIAVDEKGTEAAAATAVVMVRSTSQREPETPIAFRADRPFLFYIRHRASGAVLFVGHVADPTH